jgi:uncharacterized membrane protein YedE/YeeE
MKLSLLDYIKFLAFGAFFGIVLTKSEAASWFRIQEMFLFDSFHMYGIIGTAVVLGAIAVALIKKFNAKDFSGHPILIQPKAYSIPRYLFGGTIFGLGWALVGACPGPMYTLLGQGFWIFAFVIAGALLGTFTYGMLRDRLPH